MLQIPPPKHSQAMITGYVAAGSVNIITTTSISEETGVYTFGQERPTWAALIQQLFDWDDHHLYKH